MQSFRQKRIYGDTICWIVNTSSLIMLQDFESVDVEAAEAAMNLDLELERYVNLKS